MIKTCSTCIPHAYQDRVYGKNMRVYTEGPKAESTKRCTVCNNASKPSSSIKKGK